MSEAGLRLDHLEIKRAGAPLVALDAQIAPGTVLTVMGPSGVGKSTLLAAITGTLAPVFTYSGDIRLDGTSLCDLVTETRRIGILFQDDMLFPHMSVGANLAFGLPAKTKARDARRAQVEAALAEVGLAGFADRAPDTLSGGQKSRVALMRMLLSEPRALLLDEAFSGLDADLRQDTRTFVFKAARDHRLPVLQVTHDESDATAAGGRILYLNG